MELHPSQPDAALGAPARRKVRVPARSEPRRDATADAASHRDDAADRGDPATSSWWRNAAGIALAVGLGAVLLRGGADGPGGGAGAGETGHPNWKHVDAASQAGGGAMRHVGLGGAAVLVQEITLADEDRDVATTEAVKQALVEASPEEAQRIVQEAQQIAPPAIEDQQVLEEIQEVVREPTLTPGLEAAVVQGDVSFFHIHLYDSCDEDGDVVEIIINGASFAVIPITHAGATLSVPLPTSGASTIAIRGVRDGGGGITVACRTSEGDFFSRVMATGEMQPLRMLRP